MLLLAIKENHLVLLHLMFVLIDQLQENDWYRDNFQLNYL